jgi:hypothetical protein
LDWLYHPFSSNFAAADVLVLLFLFLVAILETGSISSSSFVTVPHRSIESVDQDSESIAAAACHKLLPMFDRLYMRDSPRPYHHEIAQP